MGAMATDFRTFENINGYSYDADKTDTIYAEDLNSITGAVNALEDEVDGVPDQISAAIAAAVAATKDALYPVGSIYTNYNVSTNPATLLGFGTWTAITGVFPVGKADSGTFATAGGVGGAESRSLTNANLPRYTGTLVFHGSGPGGATVLASAGGSGLSAGPSRTSYRSGGSNIGGVTSYDSASLNIGQTTPDAVPTLPPYLVVYMWRRTA